MLLNKDKYLSLVNLLVKKINDSGGDFEEKQINRYGDYGAFKSKSSPDFLLRFSFSLEMNNRGSRESFFLKIWFGNELLLDFFDYKRSSYKYFFHSHDLNSLENKILEFEPKKIKLKNNLKLSDAWLSKEKSFFLENKNILDLALKLDETLEGDYKALYSNFKFMRKIFDESQSNRMTEAIKRINIYMASIKFKLFNLSYFELNKFSSHSVLYTSLPNNKRNKAKVSKMKEALLIIYGDLDKSLTPLQYEGIFTSKRNTRITLKILSESPKHIRKMNKFAKKER